MPKLTCITTKGGVGNTTTTANLGAILADLGLRVLLVDADIQPSLTRYFHIARRAPHRLSHMLKSGTLTPECISRIGLPSPQAVGKFPKLHPEGLLDIVCSDAPEFGLQSWMESRQDSAIEGSSAPCSAVTPRGALVGFDVDVATAVAKRLDRQLRIAVTSLEHAPRVLASGERDLIVSALSVVSNADRRLKDIDLSHAYYESAQVVVVKGRATGSVDLRKLPRIAVAVATLADQAVTALLGADDSRVARYSSTALALQDLEHGAVAAVVAERGPVLNHLISSPSSSLFIVQESVLAPPLERYSIAVRKGNQLLLGQVTKALAHIGSDGNYEAIYSRYFGPATSMK